MHCCLSRRKIVGVVLSLVLGLSGCSSSNVAGGLSEETTTTDGPIDPPESLPEETPPDDSDLEQIDSDASLGVFDDRVCIRSVCSV